ncbi:hypothetical protein KIN20_012783 [Parelaphostrongylus tenuis]|uniref:Uncharacterized protein n=1 Tax=Parelaphostrongylus tenuis TaxID=148309 RepID=A0AAD5MEL8_PARTN|nr:hypothetical protein KIN20_012779 [Parelaphostrongylus tenuis]KAJ1355392.1 hypothetical protein KIN20_012783 [Parelaphostrongylus tenuis]
MLVQFFVGFHRQLNSSTPHFGNGQYLHLPRLSVYNNYFHSNEGTLANVTSTNSKIKLQLHYKSWAVKSKKQKVHESHDQSGYHGCASIRYEAAFTGKLVKEC